jgi:serine/threonine protein kinase
VPPEEFGPYLVYEQIGLGGMATVHRAEQPGVAGFSKAVALKRMLPSVASDASLVKSFIREARLASLLRHANVAQTYDLGKVGDIYFIAMELVPGRNLRELLKHCSAVCGSMPLPIVLNILNQICDALDYAHNLCDEAGQPLNIIHRDVSPSNILVSEGGVVKLIDFGIAKATANGMNTMSGTIKGKFGYMAPEYIAGRIDARADLFALGVIAHELLTNRPLFQGKDDMDTLYNVKTQELFPPSRFRPEVPREIDAIVMTALQRDPDRRWQRATALRTALTTETKRLGLAVLNNTVVEWIEWAFQQKGNYQLDTDPSISIEPGTNHMIAAGSAPKPDPGPGDSFPTLVRTSSQQHVTAPRGSAPRGSAPQPTQSPAPPLLATQLGMAPPSISPALSGSRTSPFAATSPATTDVQVRASAILDERSIGGVLRELDDTRGGASSMMTSVARAKSSGTGKHVLFALLVLVVAAGTAAVVYFALPYFT